MFCPQIGKRRQIDRYFYTMTDCQIDQPTDWLTDWLTAKLVVWLFG